MCHEGFGSLCTQWHAQASTSAMAADYAGYYKLFALAVLLVQLRASSHVMNHQPCDCNTET